MGKAYRYMHNANTLGHAESYRLDPPVAITRWDYRTDTDITTEYSLVVVSAVNNAYAHETMVFPSDEDGQISDFSELWLNQGSTDHVETLAFKGYEIAYDPTVIVQVEDSETIA